MGLTDGPWTACFVAWIKLHKPCTLFRLTKHLLNKKSWTPNYTASWYDKHNVGVNSWTQMLRVHPLWHLGTTLKWGSWMRQ